MSLNVSSCSYPSPLPTAFPTPTPEGERVRVELVLISEWHLLRLTGFGISRNPLLLPSGAMVTIRIACN